MTRTKLGRYSCMLAIITTYLAAVPSLAFAQRVDYREVTKTIYVNSPPRKNPETKPGETTNNEQQSTVDWQSTRWHMTMEQVAAISRNIIPTTTAERRDHTNPDVGIALLKARYVDQEVQYTAFYWFRDNKLVAVAIKPGNFWHWPKVNFGLEKTYGQPSEDKTKTSFNGGMHCVVRDKKWISEREGTVIKFLAQDCKQSPIPHLNFFSIQYEALSTAAMATSITPLPFGPTGLRYQRN